MGILKGFFGKSGAIEICAPCAGRLIALKEVDDPTFSEGILGQGIAILPSDGKFYAPVDGTLTTVFPTGHAAAIKTEEGAEVLLHIGLDTVKLKGEYFMIYAEEGRQVKTGELLLEADLESIKAAGYDTVTPLIISNADAFRGLETVGAKKVAAGDTILRIIN